MEQTIKKERMQDVGQVADKRHQALVFQLKGYKHVGEELIFRLSHLCKKSNSFEFTKSCVLEKLKLHLEMEKAKGLVFRYEKGHLNLILGNVSNAKISKADFAEGQLGVFKNRGIADQAQPFYVMANEKDLGVQLFTEYPLDAIQNIFINSDDLGSSGETFLAGPDGFFVTKARYHSHQGRAEVISANPMQTCLKKNNEEVLDLDYRLMPIIHGFRYIPEVGGGCIMAHIDQAEAFTVLRTMRAKITLVTIGFLVFALGMVIIFAKNLSRPLVYLTEIANSITKGSYSLKSNIKRDDEIGFLSEAFNGMTSKLLAAKQEIEKTSKLNLGIINTSTDLIIAIDDLGVIESCNRVCEKLLGYQEKELLGKNIKIIMPDSGLALRKYRVQDYLKKEGKQFSQRGSDTPAQRKNGTNFDVFLKIEEIEIEGLPKFICTFRDLTEIRQVQAALLESENKYELAFASIKDYGIIMLDPNGNILSWNAGAERIKGFKTSDVLGKNFSKFYLPEDIREQRPAKILAAAIVAGSYEEEAVRVRKDGSRFVANIVITPIYSAKKTHIGFIKVVRDMTEKKQLEGARQEAEVANKQKSAFLAGMSHEMRTPLNSIIGITEILMESNVNTEQRSLLKVAHNAGENLLYIINDTLDLARIESGVINLESLPFSLSEQLRSCISIIEIRAKEKHINLRLNLESPLIDKVQGDPARLRQIILNLLSNAVKFSEQGTVSLSVKKISDKNDQPNLLFAVSDEGIGIPEDKWELVFERFKQGDESITRKYGGSGLGLAISKKMVELMGGKIWVESIVGKGSTFYFTVKLPEQNIKNILKLNESYDLDKNISHFDLKEDLNNIVAGKSINILLADDSKDNRLVVQTFLKKRPHHNYNLVVVENGQEAVDKFKKEEFDLVLMDVQMPVMDGYSATREIRDWEKLNRDKKCKIVAFTAHAFIDDILASQRAGCDDHLIKPLRKEKLFTLLDTYTTSV
jgi:PAS domain S-box-containing protein